MAINQITGGNFSLPDGTPNANGSLTFELTVDCCFSGGTQVVKGVVITVPLDANGNVSGTHSLWTNDTLSPAGTKYVMRVYTAQGLQISNPYLISITTSPSPFVLP